jgi:hypothetical protein
LLCEKSSVGIENVPGVDAGVTSLRGPEDKRTKDGALWSSAAESKCMSECQVHESRPENPLLKMLIAGKSARF